MSIKIDGPFYAQLSGAAEEARRLAQLGYDGVYTLEGSTDPFLPLVLAAEHAPGLDLATGIAVAFPRNPLHLAYQAWDLQKFSQGRFMLGIGSQVKAHIEKRFACWQDGGPLAYEGRFYRHTLMTPMFNPGPNPFGAPPVLLGALGPRMTEVAGEVADGLIVHPFNNSRFLRNEALPSVQRGLALADRQREDFTLQINAIVITGEDDKQFAAARNAVRGLLGFYASTPAYLPPMAAMGFEELQPELNRLSKAGDWEAMGERIGALRRLRGPPGYLRALRGPRGHVARHHCGSEAPAECTVTAFARKSGLFPPCIGRRVAL